jgi:FAD/FMN-containing dehydrogenase
MPQDCSALIAELADIPTVTAPALVRQKSRDFYWYSPVLKPLLDPVSADFVAIPRNEAEVVAVLRACYRHDVPVTVRGAGTGNYGQAMPLKGGAVLDLSQLNRVIWVRSGLCRVQAGMKIVSLDDHLAESGQEVRLSPSTRRSATIGGFVCGGSSGIGAVSWGLLRDPGNVVAARVVTMEAEPRILELRGKDVQKINHAYGTTGVVTELEMPLAPAYDWIDVVATFDDFMQACRFGQAVAEAPGIVKKLCSVIAAPVPQQYFRPLRPVLPDGAHCVMMMIAPHAWEAFADLARQWDGRIILRRTQSETAAEKATPLYEFTWNHTTLWALKVDRNVTYLQTLFPPPHHLDLVERMYRKFGDEVPVHIEFVRYGGVVACVGLQLVRYSTEARLNEILSIHEANGCPQFNPHVYTLEEGGMKQVDRVQLAFRREADPKGLLNPGKMLAWDDPDWTPSQSHVYLYKAVG